MSQSQPSKAISTRKLPLSRVLAILLVSIVFGPCLPTAQADGAIAIERAQGPKLSRAQGHYARARSLLLAAVREFDLATQEVNPDALIDSQEWRGMVVDRARDLEHVLDPQPRVSNGPGVRFEPDSRLLSEAAGR